MSSRTLVPLVIATAIAVVASSAALAQPAPAWGAPGTLPGPQPLRPPTSPAPAFASPAQPATGALRSGAPTATPRPAQGSLFDLPDATPLTVAGRPTTAGALKRTIVDTLDAKAGPKHTVRGPARVLDAAHAAPAAIATTPVRSGPGGAIGRPLRTPPLTTPAGATPGLVTLPNHQRVTQTVGASAAAANLFCADKGPPSIGGVDGVLTPGGHASLYGTCFGDRAGHVQVIGQFGTVEMAFTDWGQDGIAIQVPAGMRGTADGDVSVTVVAADGRKSPAVQAPFRATREHVEVPTRLWQPGGAFDLTATTDASGSLFGPPATNVAQAGSLVRNLRINPACALDTMSVDVIAGDVAAIRGFDQGPPNEADTTIDWTGTCIDTTTTTTTDYVVTSSRSVRITKACRVSLEPRAWAWCPAGLAVKLQ